MQLELTLDFPVSVNAMYKTVVRGKFTHRAHSQRYREYRKQIIPQVQYQILAQKWKKANENTFIALEVVEYCPDRRRRDIDNVIKPIMDILTEAGVYDDDSQIKRLEVSKINVDDQDDKSLKGKVKVLIKAL
ncbi:RusA family crossover junction endodeoxyribonuclease [Psittacicella hinzii]|uniref:Crossover junction endodeoxyribonuclease rusA n=1 Tax=Psittacicella hinzii TaxID=2028575 RepID=A0A3A1YAG0_9GAMM|nr:RusA family crossover junction endodeoxyribonuclease [Psittacicella hinzii]RIY35283.1 hypothetical protein CKF58_06815 [Psittacicella hinzii]